MALSHSPIQSVVLCVDKLRTLVEGLEDTAVRDWAEDGAVVVVGLARRGKVEAWATEWSVIER